MSDVQKFLFDTQFDTPPPALEPDVLPELEPELPPEPPAPTFSEDEMAAARAVARAEGIDEGLQRGRDEALSGIEQNQARLSAAIADRLDELLSGQQSAFARQRDMTIQIALAIARKILPATMQARGCDEIEAMVAQILGELVSEPRLTVYVADAQLETVRARIDALAGQRGFSGKIIYNGDATLGVCDCRIEWTDGGAVRDSAALWSEIDRLAAQMLPADQIVSVTREG